MSRELKFRAWNTARDCWTSRVELNGGYGNPLCLEGELEDEGGYQTNNTVIEQYTGLKDKNGKEIYEGDIVKIYDKFRKFRNGKCIGIYIVRFDELNGEYVFCPDNDLDNTEYGGFPMWAKYKVIGNIHENPELLGGKNE